MRRHPTPDPVGPGQESVWDFPRPPALHRADDHVTVMHAGMLVAETRAPWRVLETAHAPAYYIPEADVRTDWLVPSRTATVCEFKGRAAYADLAVPGQSVVPDACWWFNDPRPAYHELAAAICFYPQRVDRCTVNDETVAPLASPFYGDWPTSAVAGPWKGARGTEWW